MLNRELLVSYKDYLSVSNRYPRRKVVACVYVAEGRVLYTGNKGRLRYLFLEDNSVWELDRDEEGFPTPYLVRRR